MPTDSNRRSFFIILRWTRSGGAGI
jgi:hypothetical protein